VEPAPRPELDDLARHHGIALFERLDDTARLHVAACIVALKPQVLRAEAPRLAPIARSGALMLSIAAGTGVAVLRKSWGAPARIVRAMPNTPGAIGRGISALYTPPRTSARDRRHAQLLLAGLGEVLWVDTEDQIDAVTAISGSGPAYVFLLAESLARAGRAEGLAPAVASRLARATVSGAGAMLDADPREAEALRRDVMSPGGTTEAAIGVLTEGEALAKLMARAVGAARSRAAELRRQDRS